MSDPDKIIRSFKAYDIRGRIPDEFNEEVAYNIGKAYATLLSPRKVCVGRDVRLSSEAIASAVTKGLNDQGVDVLDIGLCPTEEVYFATSHLKLDGGIMVTASHNPMDYNGMKLVREESKPISGDTGLKEIGSLVISGKYPPEPERRGTTQKVSTREDYIAHLMSYVDPAKIKPLKIVMNCGNGCAGPILDELKGKLNIEFIELFPEPDGTFPNGIPNPILPENRGVTAEAVLAHKADLGIAWDGDCDRCFFFDEKANFIEGYYIVGFLPVMTKAGHAFIKERMRKEDAVYGGEMSAHHYFRDFSYADSGMIPWLLLVQTLCEENKPFSQLIEERVNKYPVSGEINRTVSDPQRVLREMESHYKGTEKAIDYTDGLSMEFSDWRFNLRPSNTEPVIRLNIETRQNHKLLQEKTDEILGLIKSFA
jgi:phosphomannomutase